MAAIYCDVADRASISRAHWLSATMVLLAMLAVAMGGEQRPKRERSPHCGDPSLGLVSLVRLRDLSSPDPRAQVEIDRARDRVLRRYGSFEAATQVAIDEMCFRIGMKPFAAALLLKPSLRGFTRVSCDGLVTLGDGHIVLLEGFPDPFKSGNYQRARLTTLASQANAEEAD